MKRKVTDLDLIYRHTHPDFKGRGADRVRHILVLREGGTHSVPLECLTPAEIAAKLPYALKKEEGKR